MQKSDTMNFAIVDQELMPPGTVNIWESCRDYVFGPTLANETHFVGEVTQPLSQAQFVSAVHTFADRHQVCRMRVQEKDDKVFYIITDEAPAITLIDEGEVAEDAVDAKIADLVWQEFDFDEDTGLSAPLFRAFMIDMGGDRCFCGFVFHHVASDFGSIRNMTFELGRLLSNPDSTRKKSDRLPLQYLDHLRDMSRLLDSDDGAELRSELIQSEKMIATLNERMQSPDAGDPIYIPIHLEPETARKLIGWCNARSMSLTSLFLAVQALALSECSGLRKVPVDMISHGRASIASFRTMGSLAIRRTQIIDIPDDGTTLADYVHGVNAHLRSTSEKDPIELCRADSVTTEIHNFIDITNAELVAPFVTSIRPEWNAQFMSSDMYAFIDRMASPSNLVWKRKDDTIWADFVTRWWNPEDGKAYIERLIEILTQIADDDSRTIGSVYSSAARI